MPKLQVTDRNTAGLLLTSKNHNVSAVVSLTDPASPVCGGFEDFSGPKLHLEFVDMEPGDGSDEALAKEKDIKALIDFAGQIQHSEGIVLVHCFAGQGRSTAVGFILQCVWWGSEREWDAMQSMLRGCTEPHRNINPNLHVIRLADFLLNRNGELIKALGWFQTSNAGMYS